MTLRTIVLSLVLGWIPLTGMSADDAKDPVGKIEPEKIALGRPVDFQRDVYPFLEANCVGCHNVAIDEGKLNLEEVETILKGGKHGPAVVAKDPDKSLLFQLASRSKKPVMPPLPNQVDAHALTPKEVGILKQWILEGATAGAGATKQAVNWQPLPSEIKSVYAIAMSAGNSTVAAGRGNQIYLYDIASGRELGQLFDPQLSSLKFENQPMYPGGAAHRDFVHSLAMSPDGKLLASGGYRVVKLWQRPENTGSFTLKPDQPVTAWTMNSDRTRLAIAKANNAIEVRELPSQKVLQTLNGHKAAVQGVAFSPDSKQLVSASKDKILQAWNLENGQSLWNFATPAISRDLVINKDGKQIITADEDNKLRVWNAAAPEEADKPAAPVKELAGHSKPVTSVALIMPDGRYVVSGSEDGTLRTWDFNAGRQIRSMTHGGIVADVAASADGKRLASASSVGTARIWDANNGQQVTETKGDIALANALAQATEDKVVADQLVKVADTKQKADEKNLTDRETALKTADEAKKKAEEAVKEPRKKSEEANQKLKAAQAELAKKTDDKALQKKVTDAQAAAKKADDELKKLEDALTAANRTLELSTKSVERAKQQLAAAKTQHENAKKHLEAITKTLTDATQASKDSVKALTSVAFSDDGKVFATGGVGESLQLWSATGGQPLDQYSGVAGGVSAIEFNGGDFVFASANGSQLTGWDTDAPWKLIATLGTSPESPLDLSQSPFENRILSLDFNHDGTLLATGGGDPSRSGELMIWDVAQRKLRTTIADAHSDTVLGVEFSRDGSMLVSGAADKFMKTFDVATGKPIRSFEGHTHHVMDVSWKADQTTLVSAGADNAIKVWNAATGEQKTTITTHSKQVTSVEFPGTSENVISAAGDKTVRYFRTSNRQNLRSFSGNADYVYCATASPDEKLVVAGGEDGVVRVWNGTNGQLIHSFAPPTPETPETNTTAQK